MPGPSGGPKPRSTVFNPSRDDRLLSDIDDRPAPSTAASQHYVPREQDSSSTLRSYYDPQRQPLKISQQTSASAVRDMALRKGEPAILRVRGDSTADRKPLKSAMKPNVLQKEMPARANTLRQSTPDHTLKDRLRIPRLAHFLSRDTSMSKRLSQPHFARSSTLSTATSDNIGVDNRPKYHYQTSWNESQPQFHQAGEGSRSTTPYARRIPDDDDMYGKAKVNIWRPPHGSQNWFDSFEISSDEEAEEDDMTPVELPTNEALPSTYTQFDPSQAARTKAPQRQGPKLQARQLEPSMHSKRIPIEQQDSSDLEYKHIHEHLLPNDQRRYRGVSPAEESLRSINDPDIPMKMTRRKGTGRALASSRLGDESAISLTSEDEEQSMLAGRSDGYTDDVIFSHATAVDMKRPSIPPRRLQTLDSLPRVVLKPRLVAHSASVRGPAHQRQSRHPEEVIMMEDMKYRQQTSTPKSRDQRSTHAPSMQSYDESNGGVPIDAYASDGAHVMAVTEEEMALLEMMRNKRAAMQKSSFTVGYRQALKREHEQLMIKRQLAQKAALEILRSNEQPVVSDALDSEDDMPSLVEAKEIRRLSTLRQEEVDRTVRLEKFLAIDGGSMSEALAAESVQGGSAALPEARRKADGQRISRKKSAASHLPHDLTRARGRDGTHNDNTGHLHHSSGDFPTPPRDINATIDRRLSRSSRYTRSTLSPTFTGFDEEVPPPPLPADRWHTSSRMTPSTHRTHNRASENTPHTTDADVSDNTGIAPRRGKRSQPTFLRPASDFQQVETTSITSPASPSFSTSRASPLTPTSFGLSQAMRRPTMEMAENSDDANNFFYQYEQTYGHVPESKAAISLSRKKTNDRDGLSQRTYSPADVDKKQARLSMLSMTSAGEDVMAAWANLGGSERTLYNRMSRRV